MSESLLLKRFDLLATAPGGVARLRELILKLAVRGKLVPQDSSDEPATTLLAINEMEKTVHSSKGKLQRDKPLGEIQEDEQPFILPSGWEWTRLASVVNVLNGRAYAKQELLDSGTPVLRVGNLFTSNHWYYSNLSLEPEKYCEEGDLLFAWSASFGPFIWNGPKSIYHYHIWKLEPYARRAFNTKYLHTYLFEKTAEIKAAGHGVSMTHMTKEKMERIVIPYPPLAEQARIVTRVEELMKLCDALERNGRLADEQHARLTATLFDALAASESAHALAENWARVAENVDLLLDRPQAVDALEQTILRLAVRGLLVQGFPSQNHSQKRAIEPGRETGVEDSRRSAHFGWKQVGFLDVCTVSGGSTPSKARPDFWNGRIPWVSPKDMKREVMADSIDHVSEVAMAQTNLSLVPTGSLLMVVRGMILAHSFPIAITAGPLTINQDMKALTPSDAELAPYLALVCKGFKREILALVERSTHGTCKLESSKLFGWMFGLPPIEEQRLIVARVQELRNFCTQIRKLITESHATQAALVDALVTQVR